LAEQGNGKQRLTCPECGRTFTRAASLGAHRRMAHGVEGARATTRTASARRRATAATPTRTRARSAAVAAVAGTNKGGGRSQARPTNKTASGGPAAATARRGARSRRASARATDGAGVDRDALLRALFPKGLPPREQTIRAVSAWLDEAERLAKQR
jgi:uncharacterized C2H2 Zn-finger protein